MSMHTTVNLLLASHFFFVISGKELSHPVLIGALHHSIKILHCSSYVSAFEQYAQFLKSEYPGISIDSATYHPHRLNEVLSNVVFYGKFVAMAAVIAGPATLQAVGINDRQALYVWAHENKFLSVALLHILGGFIESQLLSTGAFEVYVDDMMVWSTLETGRLPTVEEVKSFVKDISKMEA
eukprot:Em0021g844a